MLLVHPGGPFWRNKDEHAWSIPKGLVDEGEDVEAAARREFAEETGHPVPDGPLHALGEVRIGSGKRLRAFAARGDLDPETIVSTTFEMEWPPRSGRMAEFPEVDRAAWIPLTTAAAKLHKGQAPIVGLLTEVVDTTGW